MRLFDTHAHLTDERFDGDRDALIASFPENGVALVMDIACDVREAEGTLALIEKYPFIYAMAGMHPHEAGETALCHMDKLRALLSHPKVKGVGEIGLDYHYDFAPREVQRKWFAYQLELAQELGLPVSLHIREAFGDCMDILRAHKNGLRGVMHCFSGSLEIAYECIELGLHVAFGGAVTFSNAKKLPEAAAKIPLERLLLETDCPYMTPVPHRGTRNDPTLMRCTAEFIAKLRGMDPDALAEATLLNGVDLFGITEYNHR